MRSLCMQVLFALGDDTHQHWSMHGTIYLILPNIWLFLYSYIITVNTSEAVDKMSMILIFYDIIADIMKFN